MYNRISVSGFLPFHKCTGYPSSPTRVLWFVHSYLDMLRLHIHYSVNSISSMCLRHADFRIVIILAGCNGFRVEMQLMYYRRPTCACSCRLMRLRRSLFAEQQSHPHPEPDLNFSSPRPSEQTPVCESTAESHLLLQSTRL